MTDEDTTQTNTTTPVDDTAVTPEPIAQEEQTVEQPIEEQTPTEAEASDEEIVEDQAEDTAAAVEEAPTSELDNPVEETTEEVAAAPEEQVAETATEEATPAASDEPLPGRWYVVHTYSGHENKVSNALKQKIASEHLENKIFDILVPTQDKIEIRSGKKEQVKEKIFPGYILVRMDLDDASWLAVRTTPGVTAFVGMGNKPTPISEAEVRSIVQFMNQGAPATFKDVFLADDTVKIIDGPFSEFIGKVDSVDKEKGKVRILVSIFGRETPVELDFLQVQKL